MPLLHSFYRVEAAFRRAFPTTMNNAGLKAAATSDIRCEPLRATLRLQVFNQFDF